MMISLRNGARGRAFLKVRLSGQPNGPSIQDIRAVSARKLATRNCTLLRSLLITNALSNLEPQKRVLHLHQDEREPVMFANVSHDDCDLLNNHHSSRQHHQHQNPQQQHDRYSSPILSTCDERDASNSYASEFLDMPTACSAAATTISKDDEFFAGDMVVYDDDDHRHHQGMVGADAGLVDELAAHGHSALFTSASSATTIGAVGAAATEVAAIVHHPLSLADAEDDVVDILSVNSNNKTPLRCKDPSLGAATTGCASDVFGLEELFKPRPGLLSAQPQLMDSESSTTISTTAVNSTLLMSTSSTGAATSTKKPFHPPLKLKLKLKRSASSDLDGLEESFSKRLRPGSSTSSCSSSFPFSLRASDVSSVFASV